MAPATRARPGNIPKIPAPPNIDRSTRRSLIPPSPSQTDEDFQDATEYTVNNKNDALAYLNRHLLCILDRPMDMQNVIATLHHINQLPNISMTIREAL